MYCGFPLVCSEPKLMDTLEKQLTKLSFTLHWHPFPNKTFLDSLMLFYKNNSLIYKHTQVKRQQPSQSSIGPIPSDFLEYTVDDLTPYSTYCFWLQAVYSKENVTFDHKESEMLCDIVTPATGMLLRDLTSVTLSSCTSLLIEPSAPLNLMAEEITSTWISISWKPPIHKNGIIQYYTVSVCLLLHTIKVPLYNYGLLSKNQHSLNLQLWLIYRLLGKEQGHEFKVPVPFLTDFINCFITIIGSANYTVFHSEDHMY